MEAQESEEDRARAEIVAQLRESMARSREMMLNPKLDPTSRETWTQRHTNTAQVLNQVLRDRQFKDWERRLKEMEARGRILRRTIRTLETSRSLAEKEQAPGSPRAESETTSDARRTG